ncbi:MAG: flippase-like domain-containing protein [Muribaculaceae bacterium]|nr:flippase-like domain-containing protein [Muribaculaceae bacterium]
MTQTPPRRSLAGRLAAYGIPLVVSAGLCYVLFTSIDFGEMAAIVRRDCRPWWIVAALAVSILSHVARAARWRIQLRALDIECSLWQLTLSIFGTYAVNLVFPRLGELWRTTYVARRTGAPFTRVFGSMVADRLSDTLTVLLLILLAFALASGHMMEYLRDSAGAAERLAGLLASPWLWAACLVLGGAAVWWVARSRSSLARRLRGIIAGLWQGFAVVATMRGRGRWLLLTVGVWGCYYLQLYLAFYAFPFTASLASAPGGAVTVLVTFVLSSISMAVPSNGGIGPWQWAVIFALGTYGLAAAPAGAFANMVLGTQTLLLIALGIFTFACIAISNKKNIHKKPIKE